MGFFLLGRGREHGDLRVIIDELFDNRQDALDALSRLSVEPDFSHRDAEVFVIDLDTAVPVLLVAPPAPVPAEPVTVPEVIPASLDAEELAVDVDSAVELETPEAAIDVPEPALDERAGVWEAPELAEPDTAQIADAPIDDAITEAILAEEPEGDDLADALKRATGSLEAQGIAAPVSIGPDPLTDTETFVAEDASVLDLPASDPAVIDATPVDAAWPWEAGVAAPDAGSSEPEPSESIGTGQDFEIPAFEEPSIDDTDLLSAGPEEYVAPKPVIMGSYGEDSVTTEASELEVAEPASVTDMSGEIDLGDGGAGESMLADLEAIEIPEVPADVAPSIPAAEPVEPASETHGDMGVESDLSSLTCDDCVYVNTCPNKEESQPASCGTFQWKSV